jgi:nucleoside-diphosphate-sugar epimerase
MNHIEKFEQDRDNLVESNRKNKALVEAAHSFLEESADVNYSYNFSWLGRPIIQYPPYDSLEACLYWNLNASLKLFNQAHHAGISKFLVAGSCFEYGKSGERYEYIPVDAPLEPTKTYQISKAAASVALSGWR